MGSDKKRIKQIRNWLDNEINYGKGKKKEVKRKRINRKQYGEL